MKTKQIIILSLAIIMLIAFSCKKETPPTEPTPKPKPFLDNITRDFVVFQPGSKWIYQCDTVFYLDNHCDIISPDSFEVPIDTVEVIRVDSIKETKWGRYKNSVYVKASNSISSDYGYLINYSKSLYITNNDSTSFRTIIKDKDKPIFNFFSSSLDTGIVGVYLDQYHNNDTIVYYTLSFIDTLTVNNTMYHDIRKLLVYYPKEQTGTYKQCFYWANHVGLIKFYDLTPYYQSTLICGSQFKWWSLVSKNIQQ